MTAAGQRCTKLDRSLAFGGGHRDLQRSQEQLEHGRGVMAQPAVALPAIGGRKPRGDLNRP